MKYNEIYAWNVLDEIKDGHKVHVVDKKTHTVFLVNEMSVEAALKMTESKERGRFTFWYTEVPKCEVDNG